MDNMLCLFVVFSFLKYFATGENHYLNIFHHSKIKNIRDSKQAKSFIHCGVMCTSSDNCWSANYNFATAECQLSEVVKWNIDRQIVADADWTVLVIQSVKTIGTTCNIDTDCLEPNSLCISERCFCHYTAKYNTETGVCEIECDQYASGFDKYERKAITLHNLVKKESVTVQQCMDVCVDEFGISCGSFDYSVADQRCMINQLNYQQVQDVDTSVMRDDNSFDVYSRHC